MITRSELKELQKKTSIEKSELIDINTIKIDPLQPVEGRLESYLNQIRNPYHFLCGEVPVIVAFSEDRKTLSEKLEAHFIRQKAK